MSRNIQSELQQTSAAKLFLNGTHRSRDPADTLARVKPYFPVIGITRIANVTGLDRIGIPVTVVCRPNSRSVAISQGKGVSLPAATASGVMESIETYHAEHITLPLKYASLEELRYTHELIDMTRLPEVAGSRFHPFLQTLWIEGQDLLGGSDVWLPYELVHTNYTRPMPPGSGSFLASSNGLASGNNLSEAVCHAICEVVERDAVALWTHSSDAARHTCRVKPETISDLACCELLDRFKSADIDVAVWDVTSDTGIPAMLVWIMEGDKRERLLGRPSVGAGCHPVREIALSRALSEAAQERLTLITGSRDDLHRDDYRDMDFADVFACTDGRDFAGTPTAEFQTSGDDVTWLLKQLRQVGIDQVIMVDLSQDIFSDISVARVVIPGLESAVDDARYVPGPRAQTVIEAKPG